MEIYKNKSLIDIEHEEWIDVIGYDGIYAVSNLGRVKGLERVIERENNRPLNLREKIKSQQFSLKNKKKSALKVALCTDSKLKYYSVSRLVFFSFNFNVKNLPEYYIMHIDGNWMNNKLDNLKIAELSEISIKTFTDSKMKHLKKCSHELSKHKKEKGIFIDNKIIGLECINCLCTKRIIEFRNNRNVCKDCNKKKDKYKKQNG